MKTTDAPMEEYFAGLTDVEQALLAEFWVDFRAHCLISKSEQTKLREDFARAIVYLHSSGIPLSQVLDRLEPRHLGGFYARPSAVWFPLDDAAKIYPISMEHGRMTLFRMSVYLKQPIVPELLQMALNFTVKRFPSFATTLKKGIFWHYLDASKRRYSVEQEQDVPCQPLKVSHSRSQSFRVLHYGNRISVEFFHTLTDGTGGMTFLKVLTAEYLRLTGIEVKPDETLWDVGEIPEPEEFENAFTKVPLERSGSGFVDKTALQMNGQLSHTKPCRVLHFKMDADRLRAAAKAYDATITVYLLALEFLSAKAAIDDLQGDVSIQVPVNMRKFYPSKTVRNFSMYCGVRIPIQQIRDMPALVKEISGQLQEKASAQSMTQMLTATVRLVGSLRYIPLFIKRPVAKMVYGFLGDKIFTTTLSNLGAVALPKAMADQIESMDFVLGNAITNRLNSTLITVNDTATLSITKITKDPTFEERLYQLLEADGITVSVEGSSLYEN